jgi:hypothetical protein
LTQPFLKNKDGSKRSKIKRTDANTYEVKSQSGHGVYEVLKGSLGWICQCPDHIYRGVKCKHVFAVEFSVSPRAEVAVRRIEPIENLTECIYCGSSNITKDGIRNENTEGYSVNLISPFEYRDSVFVIAAVQVWTAGHLLTPLDFLTKRTLCMFN